MGCSVSFAILVPHWRHSRALPRLKSQMSITNHETGDCPHCIITISQRWIGLRLRTKMFGRWGVCRPTLSLSVKSFLNRSRLMVYRRHEARLAPKHDRPKEPHAHMWGGGLYTQRVQAKKLRYCKVEVTLAPSLPPTPASVGACATRASPYV
ncbi:hypothetical protein BX600DRAFT_13174 [Xylariales sp. PMI_506]|nr:hypothetical protein BX600DRAFT_13174 [Xylariales sp. PMI_506]